MPQFSIVITATRPRLVPTAIKSALAQDFEDFEIIVSDNSDEGFEEALEPFSDPRLRYRRPPQYLNIIDHWNYAISHASGDWQLVLCDDDAIVPNLLPILWKEITRNEDLDTISWTSASYCHEEILLPGLTHRFVTPGFTSRRKFFACRDIIEEIFATGVGMKYGAKKKSPFFPRAAYSRRVIEKILEAYGGRMFLPFDPMTSGALAALSFTENTLALDLPLRINGSSRDANGMHFLNSATFDKAFKGMKTEFVPMKSLHVLSNPNADTVLRVQRALPEQLGRYKLNWENYFVDCHLQIQELFSLGYDASSELADFEQALGSFPEAFQHRVRARLNKMEGQEGLGSKLLRKARNAPERLARALGYKPFSVDRSLDTRRIGCNDIFDCAQYLGRIVSQFS